MARFSETVMQHFMEPRNRGPLAGADAVGVSGTPGRGPYLVFYLQTAGHRVTRAGFESHECGATVASGSMLSEMVTGSEIAACLELSSGHLVDALDGLPPDKQHCAGMAIHALRQALAGLVRTDGEGDAS